MVDPLFRFVQHSMYNCFTGCLLGKLLKEDLKYYKIKILKSIECKVNLSTLCANLKIIAEICNELL